MERNAEFICQLAVQRPPGPYQVTESTLQCLYS
jgi:hypothetical protein